MKNIEESLSEFINLIRIGTIEIYNEFSLQHELGIFLRDRYPDYKVQFERNTKFFGISGTVKHEIDIVIYNDQERYAIELKYPVNGQYPEQMFSFIKDIKFMEELKEYGFDATYCFTVVGDKNFYSGQMQEGVYSFFRGRTPVHGIVSKPTGKKNEQFTVNGTYSIDWENCGKYKFYLIHI